ncbi:hypothetical protein SDRG_09078 [Saprolegnia diclina VS20]|uniref:WRKY19-like zinc finger domain-containing protein n=1 Tax=Saprolegnia diclina (strain VS20) TaxID=1156394 RepID=T0RTF9_SAPDV|nr:hypothetical protein SDRG_09078 [Saprolegnia diclina VS20]EQC33572.1 hypothetical protein SDRG_09078 [Saprolegnia diclina VS20]|eukprot:XP_008613212.1 hypothetical protein SDRG_09078 [Saprolegnia diclina VS20]
MTQRQVLATGDDDDDDDGRLRTYDDAAAYSTALWPMAPTTAYAPAFEWPHAARDPMYAGAYHDYDARGAYDYNYMPPMPPGYLPYAPAYVPPYPAMYPPPTHLHNTTMYTADDACYFPAPSSMLPDDASVDSTGSGHDARRPSPECRDEERDAPPSSFAAKEKLGMCLEPSCSRYLSYKGLCKEHGYRRMCITPLCTKTIQGKNKCIAHGGGKPCKTIGCPRTAQSQGLCKTHGGGSRCTIPDCSKSAQSKGLCRRHGGGSQCTIDGCTTMVQRNGKCAKHNGTQKCNVAECTKTARGGGECVVHRKPRLCTYPRCKQLALTRGVTSQLCADHTHTIQHSTSIDARPAHYI